jgi:hypothetical protein
VHEPDPGIRRLPAIGVLLAGAAFAALASLAASVQLVQSAAEFVRAPGRLGPAGAVVFLGGVMLALAVIGGSLLLARARMSDRRLMIVALALVVVIRGAAAVVIDAPLAPDGEAYLELSRWLSAGNCCLADRPTGYPALLLPARAVLGETPWSHEAVNLVFALAGAWFVFDLAVRAFGRRSASVAVAVYALLPGLALLTPVLLTDTVYATLLIATSWVATRVLSGSRVAAVGAGLLLAATQYVRPVGPALATALASLLLIMQKPPRRSVGLVIVLALSFLVPLVPVVTSNLDRHGDVSVSTSAYGGWSLYMGTNPESDGRYSAEAAAFINTLPGDTLWERSEEAGRLGFERIATDPLGFASLAVTKFRIMWGVEDYPVRFALRPDGQPRGGLAGIDLFAQLTWVALLVASTAGFAVQAGAARAGARVHGVLLVAATMLLAVAAVHTFLEVKPRYHAHVEPLLIVVAAAVFADRGRPGDGEDGGDQGNEGEPG